MSFPLFSIIVPCYNQENYLAETLDSVLLQTFHSWECIIINDGSTDGSEIIIDKYCRKDSRFRKLNQENMGLAEARNSGIRNASGNFILPLDGDDKIGKQYLELAEKEFSKDKEIKLIYSKARFFGTKNKKWILPVYQYESLLFENLIFCSAIFRKQDFEKTTGYDPNMKFGFEDWEFWLQLLTDNDKVYQLDSVQFYYRQRDNSMISFVNNDEKLKQMQEYVFSKHRNKYESKLNSYFTMPAMKQMIRNQQKLKTIERSITYKTIYKIERELRTLFKKIKS